MRKNALPILLTLAALLGIVWPEGGRAVNAWPLPLWGSAGWVTVTVFLISGWSLDLSALRHGPWARVSLSAIAVNLALGPALAWSLLALLRPWGLPGDLDLGLAVIAATPTTLNTGLSIAVAGGGSLALAVLLVVVIYAAAALTLPWQLPLLFPALSLTGITPLGLLSQLGAQVLLPLVLGLALRRLKAPPPGLLLALPLGVATVIWLAVSRHQGSWPSLAWAAWALVLFVALRGSLDAAARWSTTRLGLDPASRRSYVIVASQKSVVLAAAILAGLPAGTEAWIGGAALFCVAYHLAQAFWDSAWAPKV